MTVETGGGEYSGDKYITFLKHIIEDFKHVGPPNDPKAWFFHPYFG